MLPSAPPLASHIFGRFISITTGIAISSDFQISTGGDVAGYPRIATDGSTAIVIWENTATDVVGRLIDLSTQTPQGSEFAISTGGTHQIEHQVVASNGKAFVVWRTSSPVYSQLVRGRFISLNTGPTNAEFDISPGGEPRLAVKDDDAIVVWTQTTSFPGIKAKFFNLQFETGAVEFLVNDSFESSVFPNVIITGNTALVTWARGSAVRGTFLDMTQKARIGANIDLGSAGTVQSRPMLTYSSGKVLAVWTSAEPGIACVLPACDNVRASLVDVDQRVAIGSHFLVNSTVGNSHHILPAIASSGDKAMVVWQEDYLISGLDSENRFRFIDLAQGNTIGPDATFGVMFDRTQNPPKIVGGNGRALATWSQRHPAFPNDSAFNQIKGLFFDFGTQALVPANGLNNFFTAPLIERDLHRDDSDQVLTVCGLRHTAYSRRHAACVKAE